MAQYALFIDEYNSYSSLKINVEYLIIFVFAYILKCSDNIFRQYFNDSQFSWGKIYQVK